MNQDASAIMKVQVSARNVAEIMNEFVGVLTFKTWVRLTLFLVVLLILFHLCHANKLTQLSYLSPAGLHSVTFPGSRRG